MPRFPHFADRLSSLSGSVFEKFLPTMRRKGADLVKLHIGDSYRQPPYALPISREFTDAHPYYNRYCNTFGIAALREALAEKQRTENGLPTDADSIMLTAGASNALNVAMMSLVNPGEEVLVLTPCWPFFPGMVHVAGGVPVEVPFYTDPSLDDPAAIADHITPHINERTAALYLNSPNNPSGRVLNEAQLQAVADIARQHQLWLISDEAYDGMTYDGLAHISPGRFPEMFHQTVSIFTFSKVYMFAGLRLGYMAAPAEMLRHMNKMMVHQLYSPSTLAQEMMVAPVARRREWHQQFVSDCQAVRDMVLDRVHFPLQRPQGAYYFFFSIADMCGERDYWRVIDELLEAGVSIAPGQDFGSHYQHYIRICYAGESPERMALAIKRLNAVLAGG